MAPFSRPSRQPSTSARPPSGAIWVVSMLMVVDLPAPFCPKKANSSPRRTEKSIPRTASMGP